MTEAAEILTSGNYSLVVVSSSGKVLTFTGRGVSDLYKLYRNSQEFLYSGSIADKVIAYGAAVLMVAAGVAKVYTPVISRDAAQLFQDTGIQFEAGEITEYIVNRSGTGRCPLEERLMQMKERSIADKIEEIERFVTNLWLNKG